MTESVTVVVLLSTELPVVNFHLSCLTNISTCNTNVILTISSIAKRHVCCPTCHKTELKEDDLEVTVD